MGANAFGQKLRRREDVHLLTGGGRFTADQVPDGAAWAVMLRSPHAHARIASIDMRAALAAPGVLAALTAGDIEGLGGIPCGGALIRLPGTDPAQDYAFVPVHPLLAAGRVRYVGESVAVVIAETEAAAKDAAERAAIEYEPLPCVTRTDAAQGGLPVWDAAPDNVCFRWRAGDDVDDAFARAAHVARVRVVNNRIHVGSMETRGAIGAFEDGRYTLVTGS